MTPRDFAIRAHGDQRYGSEPYVVHLDAVAELAGEAHQVIAYLHDVVEDTAVEPEELEALFGPHVRACVELLTDPAAPNRKQRKQLLHERLRGVGPEQHAALIVKAADRLANLRASAADSPSLFEMYRQEHDEFRLAVFRPGLCDHLWSEMDELLTRAAR